MNKPTIFLRALKLGFLYTGFKRFSIPSHITVRNQKRQLHTPGDNYTTRLVFYEIFLEDCYRVSEILSKSETHTCLEIGGNIGLFALHLKNQLHNDCLIHFYEPYGPNFELATKNLAKLSNIQSYNEAVGLEDKQVSMSGGGADLSTHATVKVQAHNTLEGISTTMVSLHTCVQRLGGNIDLLKMDCEGYEWEILKDTESMKCITTIAMEYHLENNRTYDQLVKLLTLSGHKIIHHRKNIEQNDFTGIVLATR